jgi:DNA mismatch endonuclease (patch repair protein)
MGAIRSKQNRTEVTLRKAIFARGLRYRLYRRDLPGKPDLVFVRERVAVFVDGDYWHGRLLIEEGRSAVAKRLARLPAESRKYWMMKFTKRVERDQEMSRELRQRGWRVLRFWESDVKRDVGRFVERVERAVTRVRQEDGSR